MNDTPVTPAELFKSLRASTAAMLGLDVDHLSTEQTIRVDRAVTLRLLCDHLQAQQLHGVAIDVHEFISASEALERRSAAIRHRRLRRRALALARASGCVA